MSAMSYFALRPSSRILMGTASIQTSLHSFFEAAAADLEMTVEKISEILPQSRSQLSKGVLNFLNYTTSILIPTLTSLFHHLGNQNYGVDVLGKNFVLMIKTFFSLVNTTFSQKHSLPNQVY